MTETPEFQERIGQIERLVQQLESAADPNIRSAARELVQSLLEMHSAALDRIMDTISKQGEKGERLIEALGWDPLVSSLLVLYNLHPEDFETRVRRGLDRARSLVRTDGVSLDVVSISELGVRVRIIGTPTNDLEAAVRDALYETAPDAANVIVEGGRKQPEPNFVPLASLVPGNGSAVLAADPIAR